MYSVNLPTAAGQRCPAGRRDTSQASPESGTGTARDLAGKGEVNVLAETRDWMARQLRCLAGRREYSRGNYLVRIAGREIVQAILEEFKDMLARRAAVACLFVFPDVRYRAGNADAGEVFHFLARQMAVIGDVDARELADGAALTTAIDLVCPVTGLMTTYDDFECVAFCPQSMDKADPLYDPLMYAPFASVNMSSDIYGFSCFVADTAQVLLGRPVAEERDPERLRKFFDDCADRWHRIATKTIDNFAAITDTSLCPVHRTADGEHWIAAHRDPAFAESRKVAHAHEMPAIYARRITKRWLDHFLGKTTYDATGMARAGLPI